MIRDTSGIVLGRVVRDVPPEILMLNFVQIPVPTEVVIKEPTLVAPVYRRQYDVGLYFVFDKVVNYQELMAAVKATGEEFHGTCNYTPIVLEEVFEDCGDDGHTDFRMRGWAYLRAEWRTTKGDHRLRQLVVIDEASEAEAR